MGLPALNEPLAGARTGVPFAAAPDRDGPRQEARWPRQFFALIESEPQAMLFQRAVAGDVDACIEWLRRYAGWNEGAD